MLKREESRDLLYSLDTVYTQEYRCSISNTAGTILSRLARVRAGESPVYCVLMVKVWLVLQYTLLSGLRLRMMHALSEYVS